MLSVGAPKHASPAALFLPRKLPLQCGGADNISRGALLLHPVMTTQAASQKKKRTCKHGEKARQPRLER